MPKIVDHHKQKEKLAEAAWRVILREGMERASVRNIAEEAGLSAGSLRHYFSTQSELLAFSMEMVSVRVKERIRGLPFTGEPIADAQLLLWELLPIDEERRAEMAVWLAFTAKALSDPLLQPLKDEIYAEMKLGMVSVIEELFNRYHSTASKEERALEAERLYALLDGLAIHSIMKPAEVDAGVMKSVIKQHINSICRNDPAAGG
ncbi:TetR family transcriptional regulator [Paenibacillus oenotherae]|uniref:TetR family transcriptional regulator n=1 Tax=Paenibacillus oenotherae TaxID=1435645 RepID=A0ABS7DCL0_9BACL|nr:TetR/AcrR family transcriptional regulator [Paenibacillus oenotherae]MBW7477631.1 TetR family transcriptional regulator [Paenibacillus oenotherae]